MSIRTSPSPNPVTVLTHHFFRLFFQADSSTGESSENTSVVRAIAAVAAPMLMAAFWIVTLSRGMTAWTMAGTHYLFVLYSFCAMGCITTAQWERLFPERIDFLVLLPLPLRPRTLFVAKLRAVGIFLSLFLLSVNLAGTLLLPVLAGRRILPVMFAHAVAVSSAGIASSLAVLALEALVIVLVPERYFQRIAPIVQTLLIAFFLLLFLRIESVGSALQPLLAGDLPQARWFAPLWFLALYESLTGGATATPYAHQLTRYALMSMPALAACVVAAYPAAWARRRHMALEGARSAQIADPAWLTTPMHGVLLRRADQRAIFHFIRHTLARLSRYHVYLAVYCGSGIALALALTARFDVHHGIHVSIWHSRAQAILPLLLFWAVAGMRGAFLVPADLGARWIFRMAPLRTQQVISTAKLLVFGLCLAVIAAVLIALALCGWSATALLHQAIYGLMAAVLLIDLFFFLESSVPFTRPRIQGENSLPLTLAVYVFGVPVFVLLAVTLERYADPHWWRLALAVLIATGVHVLMHWLRGLPSHPASEDAFLGENDSAVQTLGLSV
jgi:hypothetical protein